jgi:hypothetical protein
MVKSFILCGEIHSEGKRLVYNDVDAESQGRHLVPLEQTQANVAATIGRLRIVR